MDTDDAPPARTNAPEFTVSEISGAIKRTLEGEFGRVRVRGDLHDFPFADGREGEFTRGDGSKVPLYFMERIAPLQYRASLVTIAESWSQEMARVKGLPQTADTVGKIPNALKGQEERNR